MLDFIECLVLAYGYFLVIGVPVSVLVSSRFVGLRRAGVYSMAPLFGVAIQIYFGACLHGLWSVQPKTVVSVVLLFSAVLFVVGYFCAPSKNMSGAFQGVVGAVFVLVITLLVSIFDLRGIGFNDYFPLTNADTFVYLGFVDQYRYVGATHPLLEYPAAYTPAIDHIPGSREVVGEFIAAIAEAMQLETHTAFFISQRLALVFLVTGIFGVLLFVTSSVAAAMIGVFFAAVGNYSLHQILQQFASSSLGAVLVLVVVFFVCWENQKRLEFNKSSWSPIGGFVTGLLLIVSAETAVVALFVVALWLLLSHVRDSPLQILRSTGNFVLGFGLGGGVALPQSLLFAYEQVTRHAIGAPGGHPGDWVANSAILVQASGLSIVTTAGLENLPMLQIIGSLMALSCYAVALFVAINSCRVRAWTSETMPIAAFSVITFSITLALYWLRKGYAMLKVIDYFCFLQPLVFGVASFLIISNRFPCSRKAYLSFSVLFIGLFGSLAFSEKIEILKGYTSVVKSIPRLDDFRLRLPQSPTTAVPDLVGDSLDMFLYVNRFDSVRLAFYKGLSYRYSPLIKPENGMPFVRFSVAGSGERLFSDITHAVPWRTAPHLVPYDGAVQIAGGPLSNWLSPEGGAPKACFGG